jgi:hypothetical protein
MEFVKDIVSRLARGGVPYAITGSIASNYWGVPRLTHDVDIVVVLALPQVEPVVRAFADRYYVSEAGARQAVLSRGMFNVLDTAAGFKADLWVPGDDPFTQSLLDRRRRVELLAGFTADIGAPEDVLLHKLVWHQLTPSERQLADAAGIAAVQAGQLDLAYMRQWAARQSTADLLEAVLLGKGLKAT